MRVAIGAVKESMKGHRGSTVVEFAIVLLPFMMLLVGIMDMGRYFFVQHTMQYATREGTRLALVGGTLPGVSGNTPSEIRLDSIIKEIKDNAKTAVNPADILISIFKIDPNYADPSGWQGQQNAGEPGDYMRVRTRYNYSFLTPLIGHFFTGAAGTIQAEATYRNELF